MKKLLSTLLVLLALALMLSACNAPQKPDNDTQESENDTKEETKPQTIYGIWYSKANQTVLEIDDLANVTYYTLKIGFYEYDTKITAPCTYEDYILTMTAEDGSKLTWVFDAQSGVLSANNGSDTSSYKKTTTLPTEYHSVLFADYSKIDCESLVTLGAHTGLTIPTDAESQAAYQIFDAYYGTVKDEPKTLTTRTTAQMGDIVKIDYTGYLNDKAFEGGTATAQTIFISSNSGYIPGFAEGIAGHEVGSSFDVHVSFPEDYHSTDLAGQAVVFKMTLHAIYDPTVPDDQISELSSEEYTTYAEMLDAYTQDNISSSLWEQILKNSSCQNIPEEAYAFFLQYYREMYHYYAYYYGVDYDYILSMNGLSDELLISQAKEIALNYMAMYALLSKYELTISEETLQNIQEDFIQDAMASNKWSYEEAKTYVLENETNTIDSAAVQKTVLDWVVAQNTVTQ